jgi:hypothetical protein
VGHIRLAERTFARHKFDVRECQPMERVLAAELRAARSRKHLRMRYGAALKAWGTARAAEWQLPCAAGVADVVAKLNRLCTDEVWTPLSGDAGIVSVDRFMRLHLWAFVRVRPPNGSCPEQAPDLTIDEISNLMRIWFPAMDRAYLRTLLHRMSRVGQVFRERRGVYHADSWRAWRRAGDSEVALDNERSRRAEMRDRRCNVALAVHYLLPRLPIYRKARALGMSDRNFHYAINSVLDGLAEDIEHERRWERRANVQR